MLADRLLGTLEQAVEAIEHAGDPPAAPLVEHVRAARAALRAAATRGLAQDPAAMAQWWHDIRTSVTAIAGWARLLDHARDEAARIRATEAIERNAKLLLETFAHPPR